MGDSNVTTSSLPTRGFKCPEELPDVSEDENLSKVYERITDKEAPSMSWRDGLNTAYFRQSSVRRCLGKLMKGGLASQDYGDIEKYAEFLATQADTDKDGVLTENEVRVALRGKTDDDSTEFVLHNLPVYFSLLRDIRFMKRESKGLFSFGIRLLPQDLKGAESLSQNFAGIEFGYRLPFLDGNIELLGTMGAMPMWDNSDLKNFEVDLGMGFRVPFMGRMFARFLGVKGWLFLTPQVNVALGLFFGKSPVGDLANNFGAAFVFMPSVDIITKKFGNRRLAPELSGTVGSMSFFGPENTGSKLFFGARLAL